MMSLSKCLIMTLIAVFTYTNIYAQGGEFELIHSDVTGITFNNKIEENIETKENLFDYDYFYNGAGLGVLDFNNDGLQDIYFAANQEENRLYLNEGNFKFKDITGDAFSNFQTRWSTGVSIVDINNDGFHDIYVCQGGPYNGVGRKNLLFINNGDNTFSESAEKYGLADQGMSTQAVFFDFDKDGDLDCFVMNESEAYGLDPISFTRLNLERKRELYISYSHMYVNENGMYVDKSKDLGLDLATFGLGIKLSDFNNDGWQDIYISNDYYVPDMLLINQQGAGFSDEINSYLKQMSFYGMGLDIADVNNDGESDLFVLDMASGDHYRAKTLMRSMNVENFRLLVDGLQLPHQYMYNSLQISNGSQSYSNVSQLAGISSTDWSWSALIEDFNFDGLKDIHVTNGYRRYALDNDFQAQIREAKMKYNNNVPLEVKNELYQKMPTEKLQNIFYMNEGDLKFSELDLEYNDNPPSYSNGAAIADLDNDGDPDLIVNNLDEKAFVYKNLAVENKANNFLTIKKDKESPFEIVKVEIQKDDHIISYKPSTVRGYLSSSEPTSFIGLGEYERVESLEVTWSDGSTSSHSGLEMNRIHHLKHDMQEPQNDAPKDFTYFDEIIPSSIGLDYTHIENEFDDFQKEILLPYKQSTLGPFITSVDVNGDSLKDILFSNSVGNPVKIFTQTQTGFEEQVINYIQNPLDQENGKITTADLDNDGNIDLLIPASGNEYIDQDEFYQSSILFGNSKNTYNKVKLPLTAGSASKIVSIDYDRDGDEDLIECKRQIAQKYPMHAPSHLYENDNQKFIDKTKSVFPDLLSYGMINDALVVDFDKDGWDDIILVGEWSNIRFYKNDQGNFKNVTLDYNIPNLMGMWFTIEEVDLNQDDRPDFIVGNMGTNSKYKATKEKPLKVYGHDFDDNGTWDLVLSKEYKDNYVPLRGLECSSQQMPFIQDKFETYDLFAKATIDDVYGSSLDSAYFRYVNSMSSIALMSSENDKYEVVELPVLAQVAPILDIETHDLDSDGMQDIILVGNIYDTEVETPRLDGGQGLILLNKSNGKFQVVQEYESGLDLQYNIKSITSLYHKGGNCQLMIATENNGPVRVFVLKK